MRISQIMSREVVTIGMDDSLDKAKKIFEQTKFHHLLVVENSLLVGIISDRDLLKAVSPNLGTEAATTKDLATLNKRAHQIMTRKPIALNESALVKDAVVVFNQNKISCIPIVDKASKPVGILSWRDIMREIGRGR